MSDQQLGRKAEGLAYALVIRSVLVYAVLIAGLCWALYGASTELLNVMLAGVQ